MMDVTAGLHSLTFESGVREDERKIMHLRARASRLTFHGCAHAVLTCKVLQTLRCGIRRQGAAAGGEAELYVGIVGAGHLGKQLLLCLLELTDIKPSHIKISTRTPESAAEFIAKGVECFSDNSRVAAWAHVLFLCCLPSHLPRVSADLRSHLSSSCLVYSFISAVPVTSLAGRLGHNFILKPQYEFSTSDAASDNEWLSRCMSLTEALKDPSLIDASCPFPTSQTSGGVSVDWVCAVLYGLLNTCTSAGLSSRAALSVINALFFKKWKSEVQFNAQSFVSSACAASLPVNEPFPWISLTDTQSKKTPLLRFVLSNACVQQCIAAAYKSLLLTPGASHSHTVM